MAALFKRPNMAVAAGFGLLGMATIGGFAAGFNARAALTAAGLRASALGEMSPSDTVTLRFPNEWAEAAGSAPMMVAVASADPGFTLFDPVPTYPVGTAVPTAASEAARRGWEERGGTRTRSRADDDDDRRLSRSRYRDDDDDDRRGGRRHGGWYGDPEGHSEAARRGRR